MRILKTKKYLSILIVFAICLTFFACSKGESSSAVISTISSEAVSEGSSETNSALQSEVSSGTTSVQSAVASSKAISSTSAQSSKVPTQSKTPSKVQSQPNSQSTAPTQSKVPGKVQSQTKPQSSAPSSQPPKSKTVRIVVPEGFTLSQIGDRLEANGVCKKADLLSTANSYDFSYYSLIGKLDSGANRCYKLEGYLFPDTYEFYTNMDPQDALGRMLKNAGKKIGSDYSYSGMSTDQIVALASIIQKEAGNAADMKKISSVFHNRLNAGMRLQADPTIIYIEKYVKPNLTGDVNRYNSYYNTYKCAALPTGAICNPGKTALDAAVNPDSTDYLYFLADKEGHYYYAKTLEEHNQNRETAGV